ncbi:MAG: multidrug transporter subunit MdtD [Pseudomonadota bacterium]
MSLSVPPAIPASSEKSTCLLWIVAIGFFMQALDSTVVNTTLPAIANTLNESPLRMQSVIISYVLTTAMLIPASGWLADHFGTRRTFLIAIILFTSGSVGCALSSTLQQLVIARIIQGAGGALLVPVGRLSLLRAIPRNDFLQAMSFVTIPGLIGPLIGPTLGGWLVEVASWHWVFLINLPIGVAGYFFASKHMPDFRSITYLPFDYMGYILLSFSMIAISLSLDGLSDLAMQHATVLILLFLGLVSLTAYWLRAIRFLNPLFPLALFKVHSFCIGFFGNLFARIGSGSMPFLIPLFLQVGLGYSPVKAGVLMIPVAVAGIVSKKISNPLIKKMGYRNVLVINTLCVGIMIASFSLAAPAHYMSLFVLQLIMFGAVNSLQFTAMNTVTLKDLKDDLVSSGNSLLSMIMMLSMSFGVATAGGLLRTFREVFSNLGSIQTLKAFQYTFICIGLITIASTWIFGQLDNECKPPLFKGFFRRRSQMLTK